MISYEYSPPGCTLNDTGLRWNCVLVVHSDHYYISCNNVIDMMVVYLIDTSELTNSLLSHTTFERLQLKLPIKRFQDKADEAKDKEQSDQL